MSIESMPELEPPFEIFEFKAGEPAFFKVINYKIGRMNISPRWPGAPASKTIEAVRLFVDPETKKYYPPYWDITPRRLVYQLAGMLAQGIPDNMYLKIERDVPGPKAHFSVQWVAIRG